jgi:tellurite resistance protein TerC
MIVPWWAWAAFFLIVFVMLAIDLGLFQRKAHAVQMKEAAIWTGVWIGLALLFGFGIYLWQGTEPALAYYTGYVIEKALSVDNLFVFALIFGLFAVPPVFQHRVLFWGVLGALIMRGIFIFAGSALLMRFHWVIYVFGAFLVFTAFKLLREKEVEVHPENNPVVKLFRKFVPMTPEYHGEKFFIRDGGRLVATLLFLVLIVVESTDLVFAVDSIPAIFAVTQEPFLIYTSNVFAILGLRSLYFLLAGAMGKFYYLRTALAAILGYVGIKMLLSGVFHIPVGFSLGLILVALVAAIAASLLRAQRLARAGRLEPLAELVAADLEYDDLVGEPAASGAVEPV